MPKRFALPKDLDERTASLASDLANWASEARDAWDERSERWQESDAGIAADAWIETLAELADTLEHIEKEPES